MRRVFSGFILISFLVSSISLAKDIDPVKSLSDVMMVNEREIAIDSELGLVFIERAKGKTVAEKGPFKRTVQCSGLGYPKKIWAGVDKSGQPLKGVYFAVRDRIRVNKNNGAIEYSFKIFYTDIPDLDGGMRYRAMSVTEIAAVSDLADVRVSNDGQLEVKPGKDWKAVQNPPFDKKDLSIKSYGGMFSPLHLVANPKILGPISEPNSKVKTPTVSSPAGGASASTNKGAAQ